MYRPCGKYKTLCCVDLINVITVYIHTYKDRFFIAEALTLNIKNILSSYFIWRICSQLGRSKRGIGDNSTKSFKKNFTYL